MIAFPKRKPTRLKGYDYSRGGAYFITICTKNKKALFSNITVGQGLAPAETHLTKYGEIAKQQILSLENRFSGIKIDSFIIMPNHIHLIISLNSAAGASPCPTVSQIICSFKSLTTRYCQKIGYSDKTLFQTSFHDHIIRGERDYFKIWEYVNLNAEKWEQDCFYLKEKE